LPVPTKLFMCLLMVAGRLEVMTVLVVLTPSYWKG
jgi:trk system potassium uptake protein TrkH